MLGVNRPTGTFYGGKLPVEVRNPPAGEGPAIKDLNWNLVDDKNNVFDVIQFWVWKEDFMRYVKILKKTAAILRAIRENVSEFTLLISAISGAAVGIIGLIHLILR